MASLSVTVMGTGGRNIVFRQRCRRCRDLCCNGVQAVLLICILGSHYARIQNWSVFVKVLHRDLLLFLLVIVLVENPCFMSKMSADDGNAVRYVLPASALAVRCKTRYPCL